VVGVNMNIPLTCARIAALSIAAFAIGDHGGQAQESLVFGRWKMNPAKTNDAPKSETRVYEDRGGGFILSTRQGVDSQGREFFSQYAAKHDGKDYPRLVKGAKAVNTITFQQVDPCTSTYILKSDGKITATGKTTLSKDGKILTVETTNVNDGRVTAEVYDKQ